MILEFLKRLRSNVVFHTDVFVGCWTFKKMSIQCHQMGVIAMTFLQKPNKSNECFNFSNISKSGPKVCFLDARKINFDSSFNYEMSNICRSICFVEGIFPFVQP